MTYTKPKNMKYVDMCKYFDEHFHVDSSERDDYLLYQYKESNLRQNKTR